MANSVYTLERRAKASWHYVPEGYLRPVLQMARAPRARKVPARTMGVRPIDRVELIGCGGTGSILAEHLARMIAGFRLPVCLCLWDGDRVELANVIRQNFRPEEVGVNKAAAMATRLSQEYGIVVASRQVNLGDGSPTMFNREGTLTITATDNLASRRLVASRYPVWWLDVGNELHHGQAILGTNANEYDLKQNFWQFKSGGGWGFSRCLPTIADLNPALADDGPEDPQASCADQPFALQGFGVNAAAALAAAMLARQCLVDRLIRHHAVYFNVTEGFFRPAPITQELYRPWKYGKTAWQKAADARRLKREAAAKKKATTEAQRTQRKRRARR